MLALGSFLITIGSASIAIILFEAVIELSRMKRRVFSSDQWVDLFSQNIILLTVSALAAFSVLVGVVLTLVGLLKN